MCQRTRAQATLECLLRALAPGAAAVAELLNLAVKRHRAPAAVVEALLAARPAAATVQAGGGWTPLHWAVSNGHAACVGLLLERGADHGAKDWSGWTPLHRAAWKGREACVRVLLERGADHRAKDEDGNTPLDDATQRNQAGCAALLRQHGQ